jgi:hypothetical protein
MSLIQRKSSPSLSWKMQKGGERLLSDDADIETWIWMQGDDDIIELRIRLCRKT